MAREADLHQQVVNYLKLAYPGVIFRTDFAAGMRMTMGQARRHKALQSSRAFPDLFIAQPLAVVEPMPVGMRIVRAGLFLELKARTIYKKDGVTLLANEHVAEQAYMLEQLRKRGYAAEFAIGFNDAQAKIDKYLNFPGHQGEPGFGELEKPLSSLASPNAQALRL